MTITDKAMNNLSFVLGLTENTDANTLMLNAVVHINRLRAKIDLMRRVNENPETVRRETARSILDFLDDSRFELPDFLIEAIRKKFGIEI